MDNLEDDSLENLNGSNRQVSHAYLNSEAASDVPSSNDGASAAPSRHMTIKSSLEPSQYLQEIPEKSEKDSEFQSSCMMEAGDKLQGQSEIEEQPSVFSLKHDNYMTEEKKSGEPKLETQTTIMEKAAAFNSEHGQKQFDLDSNSAFSKIEDGQTQMIIHESEGGDSDLLGNNMSAFEVPTYLHSQKSNSNRGAKQSDSSTSFQKKMTATEPSEQIISVPESFDDDDDKDKSFAMESVNTSHMLNDINKSQQFVGQSWEKHNTQAQIQIESMDSSDFNANDDFAQNLRKTRDSAIFRNQTQYAKKAELVEVDQETNVKGINLDDVMSIHSYQPGANMVQESKNIQEKKASSIGEDEIRQFIKLEAQKKIDKQIESMVQAKLDDEFLNSQMDATIAKNLESFEENLQHEEKRKNEYENMLEDEDRPTSQVKIGNYIEVETCKHYGIQCNGCQQDPIEGHRYYCIACRVNMCAQCNAGHQEAHPVLLLKQVGQDIESIFSMLVPGVKSVEVEDNFAPVQDAESCFKVKLVSESFGGSGSKLFKNTHQIVDQGQRFNKTWVIQNTSNFDWPSGGKVKVICIDKRSPFHNFQKQILKTVRKGETTKLTLNLKAPTTNGEYGCKFRFEYEQEGQTIVCSSIYDLKLQIKVIGSPHSDNLIKKYAKTSFIKSINNFKNPQEMDELVPNKYQASSNQKKRDLNNGVRQSIGNISIDSMQSNQYDLNQSTAMDKRKVKFRTDVSNYSASGNVSSGSFVSSGSSVPNINQSENVRKSKPLMVDTHPVVQAPNAQPAGERGKSLYFSSRDSTMRTARQRYEENCLQMLPQDQKYKPQMLQLYDAMQQTNFKRNLIFLKKHQGNINEAAIELLELSESSPAVPNGDLSNVKNNRNVDYQYEDVDKQE